MTGRYYIGRVLREAVDGAAVADLARRAECSPSYLYRLLNDVEGPSVGALLALEAALGVGQGDLYRRAYSESERLPQVRRSRGRPAKTGSVPGENNP